MTYHNSTVPSSRQGFASAALVMVGIIGLHNVGPRAQLRQYSTDSRLGQQSAQQQHAVAEHGNFCVPATQVQVGLAQHEVLESPIRHADIRTPGERQDLHHGM